MSCAPSYDGEQFRSFGILYSKPIKKWLEIEAGVEYSKYDIVQRSKFMPGRESISQKMDLSLVSIPLDVRINFLKYLFFNSAITVDLDAKTPDRIDPQEGIGYVLGLGAKYDFEFGSSLFIGYFYNRHSWVSFNSDDEYRLVASRDGFKIGFMHRL